MKFTILRQFCEASPWSDSGLFALALYLYLSVALQKRFEAYFRLPKLHSSQIRETLPTLEIKAVRSTRILIKAVQSTQKSKRRDRV